MDRQPSTSLLKVLGITAAFVPSMVLATTAKEMVVLKGQYSTAFGPRIWAALSISASEANSLQRWPSATRWKKKLPLALPPLEPQPDQCEQARACAPRAFAWDAARLHRIR